AASLAAGAKLLLLDEPTSQLDPVATEELVALLLRLNRDRGATVVVADHHIERFIEHVDRVVVLDEARVVCDASPAVMLEWAAQAGRTDLLPPVAEMFLRADERPLPVTMRQARAVIAKRGLATPDRQSAAAVTGSSNVGIARAPLATLRHVDYRYDGASENALSDINLEIGRGERIALIGANGSGKSSLLRLLKQLQKPTRGRVAVAGEVALLLQNPNDYILHERVGDEASVESLARFGLEELVDCDPRDLSGGQRQRLALAIVMQSKPQLLLLDEPSRGMDRERRTQLLCEIDAVATNGTAVVLATHDTDFAAQFATRAVLLGRGRLLADALVAEVLGEGSYFGTAVAQLLPGTGALTAAAGAAVMLDCAHENPALPIQETLSQANPTAVNLGAQNELPA
ncbi:MAG: ATP-binding cassette domain-containing protein, partial [Thermoleophilaceae bacterium]|nr:ATP-binding cassette domain-containing protein [Thermoleophilaceae bacterium]